MGVYTIKATTEEKVLQAQIEAIVSALRAKFPEKIEAIYLVGGYGRGEGILNEETGGFLNDLDLVVVLKSSVSPIKLPSTDINYIIKSDLKILAPTQFNFDFKYGSQLLCGLDIRNQLPNWQSNEVTTESALITWRNRLVSFLEARLEKSDKRFEIFYKSNQLSKVIFCLVDVTLINSHRYKVTYLEKSSAFGENTLVSKALDFKSSGKLLSDSDWEEVRQFYLKTEPINWLQSSQSPLYFLKCLKNSWQSRRPKLLSARDENDLNLYNMIKFRDYRKQAELIKIWYQLNH
ncbi:MAG: hypothetical protein NT141_03070 [candidate division WWE3 bacterium]|nr:hypothetical protein [candidate division WWE3 bacterium]